MSNRSVKDDNQLQTNLRWISNIHMDGLNDKCVSVYTLQIAHLYLQSRANVDLVGKVLRAATMPCGS